MNEQFGGIDPVYLLLWIAFNVWMVVDAIRRRAASHWYFIIFFFPVGALLYFFIIKLRDIRPDAEPNAEEKVQPNSSPSLRSVVPVEKPDLAYADHLEENENYTDALAIYRRALETDASNKQVLHGLGRCLVGLGRAQESLVHFERLLELDREYRNFSAALDYADALWEAGQRTDTLELLERLAELTKRINHRLAWSHYLAESGQTERARQELTRALEAAAQGPDASSARVRQWMDRGEQMLAALDKTDETPFS
jgi:hypothetical protein